MPTPTPTPIYGRMSYLRSRWGLSSTRAVHCTDKNTLKGDRTSILRDAMTDMTGGKSKWVREAVILKKRRRNNQNKLHNEMSRKTLYLLACCILSCLHSQQIGSGKLAKSLRRKECKASERQVSKTPAKAFGACVLIPVFFSQFLVRLSCKIAQNAFMESLPPFSSVRWNCNRGCS